VIGQVDVDVVGRVVGAEPRQVDALTADLEAALVLERLLWRGPRRVVVAQEEAARLLVADADIPLSSNRDAAPAWSAWWWE
jgi:hypothetical protein